MVDDKSMMAGVVWFETGSLLGVVDRPDSVTLYRAEDPATWQKLCLHGRFCSFNIQDCVCTPKKLFLGQPWATLASRRGTTRKPCSDTNVVESVTTGERKPRIPGPKELEQVARVMPKRQRELCFSALEGKG